jgi:secreted trypsin-like serine protease
MIIFLMMSFLVTAHGLPKPQVPSLETIQDVFGSTNDGRYGGVADNSQQVQDTIKDIVGEEFVDNVPNDYVEPSNANLAETVTVEVLADNEDCASYTETLGYMCVPYYQCSNGTIITDGAGLIDIRNGFGALNAQDGKCPGFLDVCCKDPEFVPPPPQPQPYQASCGRRNTNGLGVRIQGFNEGESQVGEWPHMCALLWEEIIAEEAAEGYEGGEIKSTTTNHFVCGASLIEPGVVLTGAHCVNGFKNGEILKVRCGEWDTQTESEAYPHQDRYVNNFVVHPLFNSQNLFNDYAVLFTTADFTMDHNVDTICLPQPGESFVSEHCFATGWGKDKFGKDGEYQVILKEVDIPVVDHYQCQDSLRQTRLGEKFKLDESFLCAGGTSRKDTCKGDGGSPLVCPSKTIPNRYIQAGIVAWGIGCGEQGTPGVYGDVAKGVCFIDHVMSCNGVGQGASTDTSLGFSSQQCGRWFQDSLPENLPDRAKDGAAHQYLSTQCNVNYLEPSFIGDENARNTVTEGSYAAPQPQTNGDGYNDVQTNEIQSNSDGYNDEQSKNAQTNDNSYN